MFEKAAESAINSAKGHIDSAQRTMERNGNPERNLYKARKDIEIAYGRNKKRAEQLAKQYATEMMRAAHQDMQNAEAAMNKDSFWRNNNIKNCKKAMDLAGIKIKLAIVWDEKTATSISEKHAREAKDEADRSIKEAEKQMGRFRGEKKAQPHLSKSRTKVAVATNWAKYTALEKATEQVAEEVLTRFAQWYTYHLIDSLVELGVDVATAPGARWAGKAAASGYRYTKGRIVDRYPSTTDPNVACGVCHACGGGHGTCANRRNA